MKKSKLESLKKLRTFQVLLGLFILYAIFACFLIRPSPSSASGGGTYPLRSQEELFPKSPKRPYHLIRSSTQTASPSPQSPKPLKKPSFVSGLKFKEYEADKAKHNYSALHKTAKEAWDIGKKMFKEVKNAPLITESSNVTTEEKCKPAITMSGKEFSKKGNLMVIPCGLTLGSHITFVGKPHVAHLEIEKKIEEEEVRKNVSQFMIELQGLKTVDGEEPPKILHYNPRLKGDWRGKPVIEQNTCYRMQWGASSRCEGWKSRADEETVDGLVKCERWINDDNDHSEESKAAWWLNRLIGRNKKVPLNWPYPFVENKLFVLTLSAGLEGYHVTVDGRHVTSFPYRTGFVLEDATGLSIHGDIDVHSIFAASLPTSHPSFAPQRSLEMSPEWQALPLPREPAELFIGILSAGNHFAERMAVRKSWMSTARQNSNYVARFFVALHGRKEVNVELKKEAEFFGDIVIVPYMDSYDLVVLKTAAIFEYGVRKAAAKYIMKCDDDTFVRINSVMDEVKKVSRGMSFYMGNMNYYHKPLRHGKWAVTYEEWPEEDYPPYANGPGYIVSADIAQFIVSEFENHTLRLFKMEDVSMGLWVEKFNKSKPVEYIHSLRYCQFGCIDDYLTAHYQSPRQMLCMWDKLQKGKPQCCNMR